MFDGYRDDVRIVLCDQKGYRKGRLDEFTKEELEPFEESDWFMLDQSYEDCEVLFIKVW